MEFPNLGQVCRPWRNRLVLILYCLSAYLRPGPRPGPVNLPVTAPVNAAEPRDIEDWRIYVRKVAERYKGRIRNYELWNEVNVKGFYSGSQEKLVELARVAYQTLKEVDPNIVFIAPSVVGEGHHRWLDEYLAKGGAEYLDVVRLSFLCS